MNKRPSNVPIMKGTLWRSGILGIFFLCLNLPSPVWSAEFVIFRYKIFRESISIPELRAFVDTGEMSRSLKSYLKAANAKPTAFRQTLTDSVEIDAVALSRFLNTVPGELLLDQLSQIIQTPGGRASRQSLRGALVQSALDDNQIAIIEILENYPTRELEIDGDRLVSIYQQFAQVADILNVINDLEIPIEW
ncbi:MAG: alpha/beta hydrolase [Cyanobacteria bacterium P01_H01_bin.15]